MGFQGQLLAFLKSEGAALVIRSSPMGDGGIVLAQSAALPSAAGSAAPGALRPWATNAPPTLPQVTMGVDDYNRVARMIQQGEKPVMAVEFESRFEDADLMAYNTIAEIPGSDRKKEVVMLGAHLDSWHAGTGATDNGIGVAVVMEAVRLLKAAGAAPRRTIRVGLWAGEEQGLLGSKAYVADHLGYFTNETTAAVVSPKEAAKEDSSSAKRNANSESDRKLIRKPAHAKISAYFNYDNGAGKIRGIYLQGNEMAQSVFRRWFEPIKDLGVETITLSNTYGTDHLSFDAIGIPGFQFIQDPLDYGSRTHHTNADTYDRVPPEDARQASVVMAVTAYQAAMAEDKVPRKPLP
jgi:acetylornithine deacetylase/succinyl-diaminopimelate desuccinylase-like protein